MDTLTYRLANCTQARYTTVPARHWAAAALDEYVEAGACGAEGGALPERGGGGVPDGQGRLGGGGWSWR